jgi:geranylgeranyl pyrophosphate synthase
VLRRTGALADAQQLAAHHATASERALAILPPTPSRTRLQRYITSAIGLAA